MRRFRLIVFSLFCFVAVAGDSVAQIPVQENLKLAGIRMHDPWMVADQRVPMLSNETEEG